VAVPVVGPLANLPADGVVDWAFIGLAAYALLGLAVMHMLTRGINGRTAVLTGTYVTLGLFGWPVLVMNAKLNDSRPVRFRQSALLRVPVLSARCRLKIAIAAHHLVALQLEPPLMICDAGQGTQPGG